MKIFAYGSNMNLDRLKERVPSASKLLNVFIKGYTIKCNKTSTDGSSKANIIKTDNDDDIVWGIIFEIDDNEKPNLDKAEGLGKGYNESILYFLDSENNPHEAQVYIADESDINDDLLPYDGIKNILFQGLKRIIFLKNILKNLKLLSLLKTRILKDVIKNLAY